MATINWHDHRTLKQHVLRQHGDFNVFQLLRLLLSKPGATSSGETSLVKLMPITQRLRFSADLSSAFPAREFTQLRAQQVAINTAAGVVSEEIIHINTTNFCIASVLGPFPEPFTEWVRDLVGERVPAMADFLDIFNQRTNLLRYELKQAQTIALNSLAPAETGVAQDLAALMGLGTPQLAEQLPLPPRAWLGLAGLLANRRKSAATLVHVLNLVLQAKVTLTPLVGSWQTIEAQDSTRLGISNQQLGQRTVLGQRVWDQQACIRLEIETLDYANACQLLPPNQCEREMLATDPAAYTSYFSRFSSLLLLLLDTLVDCEVVLHITESSIPSAWLTQPTNVVGVFAAPMRLGQTAWLQVCSATKLTGRSMRYLLRADDMLRAAA
jgi:type VI secretion system protein ImpH